MKASDAEATVAGLPIYEHGEPWGDIAWAVVGGLIEIGLACDDRGNEVVFCVGWNGRGVIDLHGNVLARDQEPLADDSAWHDSQALTVEGVGPLLGSRVRVAGLWGGGLPLTTVDGWSVQRLMLAWPDEHVVLQPPGTDALWAGHNEGCVRLPRSKAEVRTAGFSASGKVLVVASASDVLILSR